MDNIQTQSSSRGNLAARCHEIQVSAGNFEIHNFETIPLIGQVAGERVPNFITI